LSKSRFAILISVTVSVMALGLFAPNGQSSVFAQQPTGSIPTVTGTAEGPFITVDPFNQQIKVYAGPSSFDYPAIGIMLANETAPALARAEGKDDWIQIHYSGVPGSVAWVYALYVRISPGALLPRIELPPTPTPFSTPTINPTLEAVYLAQQTPTRLPTFTPPPPIELPSFADDTDLQNRGIPAGLLIMILGLFGFLGAVLSYLRGR
jgi:hypothetical protein